MILNLYWILIIMMIVQKLNTTEGQDSIVVNTADIIIQNAMATVMYGLAIVLAAMLIITLRIKNKNIKKQ